MWAKTVCSGQRVMRRPVVARRSASLPLEEYPGPLNSHGPGAVLHMRARPPAWCRETTRSRSRRMTGMTPSRNRPVVRSDIPEPARAAAPGQCRPLLLIAAGPGIHERTVLGRTPPTGLSSQRADHRARKCLRRGGPVPCAICSVDQTLETFRTKFYALVPARYVAHMDEDARAGAARAFWSRAGTRPRGTPLIRAYNPVPEVDGWSSPHSVVEIITDDMPFLVDSITAGISSLGHDVHLVIHPIIRVKRDAAGALAELVVDDEGLGPPAPGVTLESCMHLQVSRQTEPALSDLEDTVAGRARRRAHHRSRLARDAGAGHRRHRLAARSRGRVGRDRGNGRVP